MKISIDYLHRIKQANDEMGNYEAFNLYEAIEELESLQNRKCENCLYGNDLVKNHNKLICHLNVSEKSKANIIAEVSKDFCCNKWSAK